MSYIRVLLDPSHVCGLDGDFSVPELRNWGYQAAIACNSVLLSRNPGEGWQLNRLDLGDDSYFSIPMMTDTGVGGTGQKAIIFIHPLWDQCNPTGILRTAYEKALEEFSEVRFADTFNAIRRPTWTWMNRLKHDAR